MFELQRLQHGSRLVTGQENHKDIIENFFLRSSNPNATREAGSDKRPEHIVVEVQALVERRPVSSLLQSLRFRRSLENTLREGLTEIHAPRVQRRRSATTHAHSQHPQELPERVALSLETRPLISVAQALPLAQTQDAEMMVEEAPSDGVPPLVAPLPPIEPAERAESWVSEQPPPNSE